MDWLAGVYVNAMNVIHYMHDKYAYERIEMALHDYAPLPDDGVRHGRPVGGRRQPLGDQVREGEGGARRDRAGHRLPDRGRRSRCSATTTTASTSSPTWVVSTFMSKLRKYPTYRNALHTQSILTITSNVVYGKATGNTPDGRRQGEPFAPGANPMHGRDSHGIHASAASVAKIPYRDAADGISLTTTLVPRASGASAEDRITNLTGDPRRVLQRHRVTT